MTRNLLESVREIRYKIDLKGVNKRRCTSSFLHLKLSKSTFMRGNINLMTNLFYTDFAINRLCSWNLKGLYLLLLLLMLLVRNNSDIISENWGRFEGELFQHLIIKDFRICGQSLGISGLRPQAAIPTAACTGEHAA